MCLAVALTTQYSFCIESHIENTFKAGASGEEVAETVFLAAARWGYLQCGFEEMSKKGH